MKKKKKNNSVKYDTSWIPAYHRFCDFELRGEYYKWQGWGLVIRHLRDFTGMDQAIFGRLLRGYTRAQISRYETEDAEPPIDFWVKMARTFGLSISWALTGQGLPYIKEFKNSEDRRRFFEWQRLIGEKENFLKELKGWQ